ncbi:MAG TPA: hypothetical protein VFF35_09055 [Bacteroidia bacterium]|nr:hypothetical protein [Bacteroidia bacterium]
MSKFEEEPDVVIMIDEGEAHMHPQWQKELIYNLTKFLPTILNIPKIQLIVTSNSPFIISDLPHYNIVFLKSVNNLSIVDKSLVTSFAANIHDLLATSFFLDTPIGKLAENKINEVLTWLSEGQDKSQEKIDSIEKFIKIIDDPIVQEKLFQLLALKVRPDYWEEYTLELQKKLIDDKLKALRKKTI